jgi:hypothetical protein
LSRFGLGELCTIIVNAAPNIKTNKHTMYARLAKLALPSPIISIVPYYGYRWYRHYCGHPRAAASRLPRSPMAMGRGDVR